MSGLPRLPQITWIGLVAAAAMLVGSFGPWIKILGLANTSISGTDGSNDGWLVVVAGVVGGAGLIAYGRGKRIGALATVVAGIAGVATTYYDRGNISDAISDNESSLITAQVGWGLNVALGASLVLGIVGLIALLGNQAAPGMSVAPLDPAASASPSTKAVLPPAPPPATSSPADELERLADLNARGVLTDEEFQAAKARLLSPG